MIKSNKDIILHLPERRSHTIESDGICQRDHADWHIWEVWSYHGSGQKNLSSSLWSLHRHQCLCGGHYQILKNWDTKVFRLHHDSSTFSDFFARLIKPLHGHSQPLSLISRNLEIKSLIKFTLIYFPLMNLITKKFEKKFSYMFVTWRYRQRGNHHMPIAIASLNILSIKYNTIGYRFESWSPCRYWETQLAMINERTKTIRWVNIQCLEL